MAARQIAAAGSDPIAQRRAQRRSKPIPTFADMAGEVIALEQAKSTNAKVRYQWGLLLGPSYCSSILDRTVHEITTADVERILRPVWTAKPETARKLHRRLRRVFEHARIRLRDGHGVTMTSNPARWDDLKALGFEQPRKLKRGPQPSLSYTEVSGFMAALRGRQGITARALELLVMTAVRTDAVRQAGWRSSISSRRSGRSLSITSRTSAPAPSPSGCRWPRPVVQMLLAMREARSGDLVFPGPSARKPISAMGMIMVLRKMNVGEDGKRRWRDPRDGRPVASSLPGHLPHLGGG